MGQSLKAWVRRDPLASCAFLAILLLYVSSLFLPAIEVFGIMWGWQTLAVVIEFPFDRDHSTLPEALYWFLWWFPNLMVWAGLVLLVLRRWRYVAATGIAALVAVEAAGFDYQKLEFDFKDFLIGFYVWVASMAVLAAVGLWRTFRPRAVKVPDSEATYDAGAKVALSRRFLAGHRLS